MDPDLEHPPTRHLERLEVDRFRISATTIREIGDGYVVLDVAGASDATATRLPEGVALAGPPIESDSLTLRIDAVGPRTFRYRFAHGSDVPAGATPMLVSDVGLMAGVRPGSERHQGGLR